MPDIYESSMEDVVQRFRRASHNQPEWSEPSDGGWESIASALDFPSQSAAEATVATSTGFTRRTLFAGIGGILVGAAVGAGGMRLVQDSSPSPVKSAVLTPLDREDEKLGVAELRPLDVGYSLAVDVPEGAEHLGGYIEVWLINVDLKRMVSVGVFAAGTSSQFYVTDGLIDEGFLVVDLSNEEFDGEVRHSGDTIMRGELLT